MKDQILIVNLQLGFEKTHQTRSRDRYEYSAVELIEHLGIFCLPLTKNKNLQKEASMEHTRLQNFPTLETLTGDVDEYYSEQARNNNQLRLKALVGIENEELMGKWDGDEYTNEVNWPEKIEERIQN